MLRITALEWIALYLTNLPNLSTISCNDLHNSNFSPSEQWCSDCITISISDHEFSARIFCHWFTLCFLLELRLKILWVFCLFVYNYRPIFCNQTRNYVLAQFLSETFKMLWNGYVKILMKESRKSWVIFLWQNPQEEGQWHYSQSLIKFYGS